MLIIRRRAGAIALALTLLQGAALVAAAVTCAGAALAGASDECCAKGAHPPGMCPLRHQSHGASSASASATCRLSCAAATAGPVVLMPAALLISPTAVVLPAPVRTAFCMDAASPLELAPASHTPPPKS